MSVAKTKKRSVVVNLRMKEDQRELIDRAAEMIGSNRSEFMVDVATRAAQDALLDQRIFYLNDEQWEEFQAALDRPPQANERLRKALTRKGSWVKR
ncbi:MAG TPA: DUF1778 domain-containing protein [Gemmatales bacterium]|nr:DUF1778 domain-containing protein [Gemmatales bacterium]